MTGMGEPVKWGSMPRSLAGHAKNIVTARPVEALIHVIRGQKVMLDADLASLYQVTTGNLNLAVRRNPKRFPEDFMFKLSTNEAGALLLQTARAETGRGGRRTRPYAFH